MASRIVLLSVYLLMCAGAATLGLILGWTGPGKPSDADLIVIVASMGALGSFVHAGTSLATYVGNREFKASWTLWTFLRVPLGVALALIVYAVMRGGFVASGADVNAYGTAAVAGMTGMFSKQATDKLREVFDNLFKTDKADKERDDKLTPPGGPQAQQQLPPRDPQG